MFTALKSWAEAPHPDSEWYPDLKGEVGGEHQTDSEFRAGLGACVSAPKWAWSRIYDALINRLSRDTEEVPWDGSVWSMMRMIRMLLNRHCHPARQQHRLIKAQQEVYFPLPANREQRRIVEAIRRRRGVLVQGPPGTERATPLQTWYVTCWPVGSEC